MGSHTWLILLIVALAATLTASTSDITTSTPTPFSNNKYNDLLKNPGKVVVVKGNNITPTPGNDKKDTTKLPLAADPRYNKMLPEKNLHIDESTESSKKEESDDYYDNYDYDYYSDETTDGNKTSVVTDKPASGGKLKPIKGDDKSVPASEENLHDGGEELDDDDDDDDEEDDIADDEEIIYNQNVPCPRDCICARNINSYLVATCSRLDADVQKFGLDITDLVVVNVGPKYPILLGPEFFSKVGLKHVSSIKISNCTIEYIHPTAFHGLDELYSVNLTNVGLSSINPDTFAENKKLRLLTISGNDFSGLISKGSPNSHYLLKSSSVEELDLSNNNIKELKPTAFNELGNIVYINLAQNGLKNLPEKIFDTVETIEELDLSYNSLKTLPQYIFNRTALAILHLKYNDIVNDLQFGTADLQQLDLSFCSIKHVTNHMFSKMEGLTNLNLKGNGIIKIQPESFTSLRNLRHIDLSINDLDQVSSHIFFKNPELDVIRLNDNPRLSQLPTDGFLSQTGDFNVYLFDISNCAIGALGFKTFSTMPHLTTLKLAWNNINNLDKGTFAFSDKLTELDLSNNLIVKLDDLMFLHNRELSKLNLGGNPLKKLSAKLLLPFNNLRELDVSECEIHTLLADNYLMVNPTSKFYETLRSFNASFNQIKKITKQDVQLFQNLKTLDITNNPLKCNEDFKDLMKWLGNKGVVSGKVPTLADAEDNMSTANVVAQSWDDLARGVCKRAADSFKPIEDISPLPETSTTTTTTTSTTTAAPTTQKYIPNEKDDIDEDTSVGDDDDEDEEEEDDEYNEDNYDDDDSDVNNQQPIIIKDKGLFAEEVNILKETGDKFLRGKLSDEDEEVVIERGRIYYTSYRFLWPVIIIILSVVLLLFVIAKVVTLLMRKRGERYRQALLASKNSIVYQKLTEEYNQKGERASLV